MRFYSKEQHKWQKKSRRLEAQATRLLANYKKGKKKNKKPRLIISKKTEFKRPNYHRYIKSKAWRSRRLAYYEKFGKQCVVCGDSDINLHHVTYERLGREHDGDLIALCVYHHDRFHKEIEIKGDMRIETYKFIIREQEDQELSDLIKKHM